MTRRGPTFGQLAACVGFALSCVALLLFLWLAFEGPVPLKSEGYRFNVALPEATALVEPTDVRVSGVRVGTVAKTERDPRGNATLATVEMDRKFAPIHRDARFVLRQKSLVGERYLEMTLGTQRAGPLPDGATLRGNSRVEETTQIDEILDSFDPYTRGQFQAWQQDLGAGIVNRGLDLNAALGNLPGLVNEAGDLVQLLDAQEGALRGLVKNGGKVFDALSRNDRQLQALIRNQSTVFTALQRERESFAEIFRVAPTFLVESRLTLARLQRFARETDPFVVQTRPALERLRPTLVDLGGLSPDLRRLFTNLDPYIDLAQRSLPANREIFDELRPTFGALAPFLSELNPALDWLALYQHQISDFVNNFASINAAKGYRSEDRLSTGHVTRQFSPTSPETQAFWPNRRESNRGNAYLPPLAFADPKIGTTDVLPAFDCRNAGGPRPAGEDTTEGPACRVAGPIPFQGKSRYFPHVERKDYFRP